MTETFRLFDIQKSVAISVLLHAAVFTVFALKISRPMVAPIGVEVQYFAGQPAAQSSAPVTKAKVRQPKVERVADAPKTEEKEAIPQQTATEATTNGPAGSRNGAIVSALERYKYELRLFLESRKIYPESAKRLHQTGTVIVGFTVNPEGKLIDVNLSQPSGSETLNRAALDLVRRASVFKPFPKEVQMQELKLLLPIEYVL